MIEKHFTDDTKRIGPDHAFSMDAVSWREMVERTRELELAMGAGIKKVEDNELETVVVQRRSLRANVNLEAGHVIRENDFVPLRPCPCDAIPPSEISSIIGTTLRRDFEKGDYLTTRDVD
jgi:sialic acid synthase SpsE